MGKTSVSTLLDKLSAKISEQYAEAERLRDKLQLLDEMRDQLLHDAANLRDYAMAAEPAGAARVMVEVAEHLEELCDAREEREG